MASQQLWKPGQKTARRSVPIILELIRKRGPIITHVINNPSCHLLLDQRRHGIVQIPHPPYQYNIRLELLNELRDVVKFSCSRLLRWVKNWKAFFSDASSISKCRERCTQAGSDVCKPDLPWSLVNTSTACPLLFKPSATSWHHCSYPPRLAGG